MNFENLGLDALWAKYKSAEAGYRELNGRIARDALAKHIPSVEIMSKCRLLHLAAYRAEEDLKAALRDRIAHFKASL